MGNRFVSRVTIIASSLAMVFGLAMISWLVMPTTVANAQMAEQVCPAQCADQATVCIDNASSNFDCCAPTLQENARPSGGCLATANSNAPQLAVQPAPTGGFAACLEQMQGAVTRCNVQFFLCEAQCGLGQGNRRRAARGRQQ
jgi:hypothetical protein